MHATLVLSVDPEHYADSETCCTKKDNDDERTNRTAEGRDALY
jgi:hypothetical protein